MKLNASNTIFSINFVLRILSFSWVFKLFKIQFSYKQSNSELYYKVKIILPQTQVTQILAILFTQFSFLTPISFKIIWPSNLLTMSIPDDMCMLGQKKIMCVYCHMSKKSRSRSVGIIINFFLLLLSAKPEIVVTGSGIRFRYSIYEISSKPSFIEAVL